jgi:maltose O-acetyltransferase
MKIFLKKILSIFLDFLPSPHHPLGTKQTGKLHLRWRYGFIKGVYVRFYYALLTRLGLCNVRIGKGFSIGGRLKIKGPGQIVIGNYVIIEDLVTPFTYAKTAIIEIGDGTYLNGTRFGAFEKIQIGRACIIADARLMDSDFHSVQKNRRWKQDGVKVAPIYIGNDVWIAGQVGILKGVKIGDHSVVSFGSIVTGTFENSKLIRGNPAQIAGEIPN